MPTRPTISKGKRIGRWGALIASALAVGLLLAVVYPWYLSVANLRVFRNGLGAYQRGDLQSLESSLGQLNPSSEFDAKRHLLQGLVYMLKHQERDALEELGKAIGDVDTTSDALMYSGKIFHFTKDYRGAEQMLLAAINADPNNAEAHRLLSATYYDTGAFDNVLKHLARVIELDPVDMRPWRLRGLVLKDFEKYDEAVLSYQGALERVQDARVKAEISEELADCLVQLRRYDDALGYLKGLVATPDRKVLQSECFQSLGQFDEAEKCISEALVIDEKNLRALTLKASQLMERNQWEGAKSTLERATEYYPFEFNIRLLLAQILTRMGDKEAATVQEAKATELKTLRDRFTKLHIDSINNPNDANLRKELGDTAKQLGMKDAAISWYRAALGMDPQNSEASRSLAELLASEPQKPSNSSAPSVDKLNP